MPKAFLTRLCVVLAATIALAGCEEEKQASAPAARPPAQVGFTTVKAEAVDLTARLPGRVVAFRRAEVRPQVDGIVTKRLFEEGTTVTAGQPLYQIDAAVYEAQVKMAEADLARATATLNSTRTKLKRYESLVKTSAVSRQAYDDVAAEEQENRASVASANAALDAAKINLGYTEVLAPIGGRIGRSSITEGALVTAGQADALATITQLDPINVDFTQSSAELLRLSQMFKTGQRAQGNGDELPVTLFLDAIDLEYDHRGTMQFSEVTVDETTGSVRLRAEFPNPERDLLPGMFVHGIVNQGVVENGYLVPQAAASFDRMGDPFVYVIGEDDTVSQVKVHIVDAAGKDWLVDRGLSDGMRVVVDGLQRIRPGAKVTPVEVQRPTAASGEKPQKMSALH
ncbi:efflux RND transporter periplasmic adaptor subunit [Thalassobaculum sp. OXR-137]|uniref:efflux RND transporter periplasmic adaptor subunit n=1 Tax=Thalassobaculum sp. OXR-137 TaxID=3100173 RepID=UPI002AC900DE|nr:efflux RND transporter periplasmic adaptor subunit [Thalassobaculum sp. OXR-137]WPZ33748.1 efflux RND transporter periplasmic adaptor subunit [Thalassobaculum sp. OXR-137]